MSDAFNALPKQQKELYNSIFKYSADNSYNKIHRNVVRSLESDGGTNNLFPVILKEYSTNLDKAEALIPGVREAASSALSKYDAEKKRLGWDTTAEDKIAYRNDFKQTVVRNYINDHPAEVITAGLMDSFAFAYQDKIARGEDPKVVGSKMLGWLESASTEYDWDDKEKKKSSKEQFGMLINAALKPVKVNEGRIITTAFGSFHRDKPAIEFNKSFSESESAGEYFTATKDALASGMEQTSTFAQIGNFIGDHSGSTGSEKYDYNIKNILSSTLPYNMFSDQYESNEPLIKTGTADQFANGSSMLVGLAINGAVESAVAAFLAPASGGTSAVAGAVSAGSKFVKGYKTAKGMFTGLKAVKLGTSAATKMKLAPLAKKVGEYATYNVGYAARISVQQGLMELGTTGVSTDNQTGSDETQAKYGQALFTFAQNFFSATAGSKIGENVAAFIPGLFQANIVKTAMSHVDDMVAKGASKVQALSSAAKQTKMALQTANKLVDKGLLNAGTKQAANKIIAQVIGEDAITAGTRIATSSWLGKTVAEVASDAVLDFGSITAGNYAMQKFYNKNMFDANTTNMGDLISTDLTVTDQLKNYLIMQSSLRGSARIGGAVKYGAKVFSGSGRKSIVSDIKDLKEDFGSTGPIPVGMSIRETEAGKLSLIKANSDNVYNSLLSSYKLSSNDDTQLMERAFIRTVADKMTLSKILDAQNPDGSNAITEETAKAVSTAVQEHIDMNYRLTLKPVGEARKAVVEHLADFIHTSSMIETKNGDTFVDKNILSDNLSEIFGNMILDKESTTGLLTGLSDRMRANSENKGVVDLISRVAKGEVINSSGKATISRKSLKNRFSDEVGEFDVEKALMESKALVDVLKNVELGITDEDKTASLNFVKHLVANAESDMMVAKVMQSGTVEGMVASLNRMISPAVDEEGKPTNVILSKLDEESVAVIKSVIKGLSNDKISYADRIGEAKKVLSTRTKAFNDESLIRSIALTKLSLNDFITYNADDLIVRNINNLDVNDPDLVAKSEKTYKAATLLSPLLSLDIKNAIAIHPAVANVMNPEMAMSHFAKFTADKDVLSLVSNIESPALFSIKAFANQLGFTRIGNEKVVVTGKSSITLADKTVKTISNTMNTSSTEASAMEYITKGGAYNIDENSANNIMTAAILKSVAGSISKTGHIPYMRVKVSDYTDSNGNRIAFIADIRGTINDGGESNIVIEFGNVAYDSNGKMNSKLRPSSVARFMNTKDDVVRSNIDDFLWKQINTSANYSKSAEDLRQTIDTRWTFQIADKIYTLDKITKELNASLSINGLTTNKVVGEILNGTGNIEQSSTMLAGIIADRLYDSKGNKVIPTEKEMELIQVAATQVVWERAIHHGINNKLVTSLSGDVRKWSIRTDALNSWHNGKIVEVDIEYDLDNITLDDLITKAGIDKSIVNEVEHDRYRLDILKHEAMEKLLSESGFVKIDMGFANNLKNKWLYIADNNISKGFDTLHKITAEAVRDRLNISLYPGKSVISNTYVRLVEQMQSLKADSRYTGMDDVGKLGMVYKELIKAVKVSNEDAIAMFEKQYPILKEGTYQKFEFEKPKGNTILPYDSNVYPGRMDVITEMYHGLLSNRNNISESEKYIEEVMVEARKAVNLNTPESRQSALKKMSPLVARFALFGAETFSINTPAKRGSFSLLSNKLDSQGKTLTDLAVDTKAVINDFLAERKGRIFIVHSRTQDGMSWMPKSMNDAMRSSMNSFDSKYTNQAIGSKLMTTDTDILEGNELATQNGKMVIGKDDLLIEFGSIKGYGPDMARLITRATGGKFFDGNAIHFDMAKLNNEDKMAVAKLIGNITTHAVLTTRTKEGKLGTQQMNTNVEMDKFLFESGKANMAGRVRTLQKLLYGLNVSNAVSNPAMFMREVASEFGKITVPAASAPAEVAVKLREQDWTLSDDQKMAFQATLGSKALSEDLMYFVSNDDALQKHSGNIAKLADWLSKLEGSSITSKEELDELFKTIKEINPKWNPSTGTDKDVVDFIMKVMSNEAIKGDSARMYAFHNGEYFTVANRSPVVYAGQQDFVLLNGIRRGGRGIELSAEMYAKIEGGDYDGDTVGRIQCSSDIINKLYGKDFKQIVMQRQANNMKRYESLQKIFGSVKPTEGYFGGKTEIVEEVANQTPTSVNQKSVQSIAMKFKDGDNGMKMRSEFKGKSTMDLILSGNRTATSRDISKQYNELNAKVGDVIEFYNGNTKVLVRITTEPKKVSEVNREEWSKKEGWDVSVYDRISKNDNYVQFEYELVGRTTTQKIVKSVGGNKKLNNISIDKHLGALKNYPLRMYAIGTSDLRKMKEFNNPNSDFYMHNLMFIHRSSGDIEYQIEACVTKPSEYCLVSPKEMTEHNGKPAFVSKLLIPGKLETEGNVIVVLKNNKGLMATADVYRLDQDGKPVDYPLYINIGLSSIAGMNKIIQDMSVANVKTSAVQYLNEKVRKTAKLLQPDGPPDKALSYLHSNPSHIVSSYIEQVTSVLGNVDDQLVKDMKKVVDAFSVETDLSGADVLALPKILDRLATLEDTEFMPVAVKLAVEQGRLMKEAGVFKQLEIVTLSSNDLNEFVRTKTYGQYSKNMTAIDAGNEKVLFEDGIETKADLLNQIMLEVDKDTAIKMVDKLVEKSDSSNANTGKLTSDDKYKSLMDSMFNHIEPDLEVEIDSKLPTTFKELDELYVVNKDGSLTINESALQSDDALVSALLRHNTGVSNRMNQIGVDANTLKRLVATDDVNVRKVILVAFSKRELLNKDMYNKLKKPNDVGSYLSARASADALYQRLLSYRNMNSTRDFKDSPISINIKSLVELYSDNATANAGSRNTNAIKAIINATDEGSKVLIDMYSMGISNNVKNDTESAGFESQLDIDNAKVPIIEPQSQVIKQFIETKQEQLSKFDTSIKVEKLTDFEQGSVC